MTKILHMTASVYPSRGGIDQTAEDVMRALSDSKDIEQKMICLNRDAEADGVVTHMGETVHDTLMGIEVIRCGCIANIASQLISLTFKRELKKLFEYFIPDIVIMHYPNPFIAHFLLPFLKKYRW